MFVDLRRTAGGIQPRTSQDCKPHFNQQLTPKYPQHSLYKYWSKTPGVVPEFVLFVWSRPAVGAGSRVHSNTTALPACLQPYGLIAAVRGVCAAGAGAPRVAHERSRA